MNQLLNVSSNPHARSRLSTGRVMFDVITALIPTTIIGVWYFGVPALITVLLCVASAVISEALFDVIAKKPTTITDGSAIVTGLLLALCLPAQTPYYIPIIGSAFAIIVVKCLFGGLGCNFVNPALAARCFLLISFGLSMTKYTVDGISQATPLSVLTSGGEIKLSEVFIGTTSGVIGCSIIAMILGALYLWTVGGITMDTPLSVLISFTLFVGIFGEKHFAPAYLMLHLCTGGVVMGAFFMATDPVTSPVSTKGRIIYGSFIGILMGLFRIFGSAADAASYAIISANVVTPLIDKFVVPKPFAFRKKTEFKNFIPKSAVTLCIITLIAGLALGGVHTLTKDAIELQAEMASRAAYQAVCADAASFENIEAADAQIEALAGGVYGSDYGKLNINKAFKGVDASGNVVGYVVDVTSGDGYAGNVTFTVGINTDGGLNGISFSEINETAGMGMKCAEDEFMSQFVGVTAEVFKLNKAGGSTADDEIDSVSGASTTSGAVVNGVNAALDFYRQYMK